MINWSAFNWEAFAILVTGLAAVIAAWRVGTRQLEIQRRQIQLVENDLKLQLLERRLACVTAMRQISNAWFKHSELPDDEWQKFHQLVQDAQLLFPVELASKLNQTMTSIFWARQHYRRAVVYNERGDHPRVNERLEKSFTEDDKVMRLMPSLLDELIEHTRIDAWA